MSPRLNLYRRLLGSAFDSLPAVLRDKHENAGVAEGWANVERGTGRLSRWTAGLGGFPQATARTPVRIEFDRTPLGETWTRRFGRESFRSELFAGVGRSRRLLVERFGPLDFGMALTMEGETLKLIVRRWSCWGLPLPMRLCPRIEAYECVRDGLFHFHVEIAHPWTRLIVRYQGFLRNVDEVARENAIDGKTPEPERAGRGF